MTYYKANQDGEIVYTISHLPDDSTGWQWAGDTQIADEFSAYVNQSGELVSYTDDQRMKKRQRPNYSAKWSNVTFSWEDTRSLEGFKASHWTELRSQRDRLINGGFTWDGSRFDSDPASQQRIQGAVQLALLAAQAGQPFTVDWTLYDNTTRTLTGADMVAVGLALGEHVQTHFVIGQTLRDAVNAATTREEVEAVVWEGP